MDFCERELDLIRDVAVEAHAGAVGWEPSDDEIAAYLRCDDLREGGSDYVEGLFTEKAIEAYAKYRAGRVALHQRLIDARGGY